MSQQVGKATKRSKPSYLYAIISVTMVLFMLGILGVLLIYSQNISNYFRENIEVSIILKDNVNEVDVLQFQKKLELEPYIKSSTFISKDEAARIMQEDLGEDLDLLDYNPLYASVNIYLKADYANKDSLAQIEEELLQNPIVEEVYYFRAIVDLVNRNVKVVSMVLGVIAALLFIIALTLIDNTIKLLMYSNRFIIRSMQLVGATRWFIIKPFLMRGVFNGLVSGLVAVIALVGLMYYAQVKLPALQVVSDNLIGFSIIFAGVIVTGILISWLSTWRAVAKYLNMKLDDLY